MSCEHPHCEYCLNKASALFDGLDIDGMYSLPRISQPNLQAILFGLWKRLAVIDTRDCRSFKHLSHVKVNEEGSIGFSRLGCLRWAILNSAAVPPNHRQKQSSAEMDDDRFGDSLKWSSFDTMAYTHNEICLHHICRQICNAGMVDIEEIYPCTIYEEEVIRQSTSSDELPMCSTFFFPLRRDTDLGKLRLAAELVAERQQLLRTHVFQIGHIWYQVMAKGEMRWTTFESCSAAEDGLSKEMELSRTQLSHFALVEENDHGQCYLAWAVKFGLVDGKSIAIMAHLLNVAYATGYLDFPKYEIADFKRHTMSHDLREAQCFWSQHFSGVTCHSIYGELSGGEPATWSLENRRVWLPCRRTSQIPVAATLLAAWGLVIARETDSLDVVLRAALSHRDFLPQSSESTLGLFDLISPIRLPFDSPLSNSYPFPTDVDLRLKDIRPFSHISLDHIRQSGTDAKRGLDCMTNCVIQSKGLAQPGRMSGAVVFEPTSQRMAPCVRGDDFTVTFTIDIAGSNIDASAEFDSGRISSAAVEDMLRSFEELLLQAW